MEPAPPSTLRPEIPPAVDAIVKRAMAKDLEVRYGSWADFSMDLAEVFRNEGLGPRTQQFADTDKFETLKKLQFFENFTEAEIWEVTRMSVWQYAVAGETLMTEGDAGTYFCLLAEGQVKVTKKGKLLNILGEGECFGEMAYLLKSAPVRGADVSVLADAKIISVPMQKLAQASDACRHKFDRAFLEILTERLTMANMRLSGV